MSWYLAALKKYAVFSGRARRREYWYYTLFNILVSIGLLCVDFALGGYSARWMVGFFSPLYALATLIPGTAVTVRRLHDAGHTAWLMLLPLIPILGAIVLLVFLLKDSQPGDNRYGPNPKQPTAPDARAEVA
jgi:uncharacterized membrane protein YhaH (DUF805 family)